MKVKFKAISNATSDVSIQPKSAAICYLILNNSYHIFNIPHEYLMQFQFFNDAQPIIIITKIQFKYGLAIRLGINRAMNLNFLNKTQMHFRISKFKY